jgi:hypothetical protein
MKTTVEMPDNLVTELKVIAARERRKLRDVMAEVVALGLRARVQRLDAGTAASENAEAWLNEWQALGRQIEASSVDPRSCVDILLADRR